MFRRRKKKTFTARFLREEGDRYVLVGSQKFSVNDELVRFENKTFLINIKDIGYSDSNKNENIIFFDFISGKSMSFKQTKSEINIKLIDMILNNKIIAQLVSRLSSLQKQQYGMIIIVAIAFCAIGYVAGTYFAPAHQVIQYLNNTKTPSV